MPVASKPHLTLKEKNGRPERSTGLPWLLLGAFGLCLTESAVTHSKDHQNKPQPEINFGFRLDDPINALSTLSLLNQELVLTPSASVTLQNWCQQKYPSPNSKLTAQQVPTAIKPASSSIRNLLRVSPEESVRYRHVLLKCGSVTFSEADNWYVPERLEKEMNWLLENSQTPFGIVVRSLSPTRKNLSSEMNPLPHFKHKTEARKLEPTPEEPLTFVIFKHRALLQTNRGPISLVEEDYYDALLPSATDPKLAPQELSRP